MGSQYTKGEWQIWKSLNRVPPEGEGFWAVYVVDAEGKYIAKVSRPLDAETIANARLLVAAPEMAELLERLVKDGWNAGISEEAKEILDTLVALRREVASEAQKDLDELNRKD